MELRLGDGLLAVEAIEDAVVRVRWTTTGEWPPRRPWAVTDLTRRLDRSASVNLDDDGSARLETAALDVSVDVDMRVEIRSRDGRELAIDAGAAAREMTQAGTAWSHRMPPDRRYFGFGERTGLLDKRGRRLTCWTTDEWRHQGPTTDSLYVAVPFYLALDPDGSAFGVFMDTTFRSVFDLTNVVDGVLRMEVDAPTLEWFLIAGPEPARVVERLTQLVGRPAMPPRWALGYHQARWSYGSEAEVREIAARIRRERIPCDAIHLDIDHMDRFRPFTWDLERFPDPGALIADLRRAGFRTTVVVDAALPVEEGGYDVAREARERDLLLRRSPADPEPLEGYLWGGRSVFPDHARPRTASWWGRLYRRYLDLGVAGFVNDMNEPAMHDRSIDDPNSGNTEPPADAPHGEPPDTVPHAEFRNVYALAQARATAAGLRSARPRERPMLVSRSGFAGIQRDAMIWTGDNWSLWEHLEMSLPQLVNLGLSGLPLAGADIGGFFDSCSPELLVRWTQLGALYPFARNNSASGTARQEPWAFGEPTTSRCRRAIELRYRLLPYLATVVEEATRTGHPVLRPLWFHHPGDPDAQGIVDEAFVGRDLLIAPVMRPGKQAREVWLPPGGWYDIRTGRFERGGEAILASATLDEAMPIFARAGSILPVGPVLQWTDERPLDRLVLDVFLDLDGRAEGELYEDDGASMEYLDGSWCRSEVQATTDAGGTEVRGRRQRRKGYEPPARTVEVVVHGASGRAPDRASTPDGAAWNVSLPRSGG
jgi:alpha-glucosidase